MQEVDGALHRCLDKSSVVWCKAWDSELQRRGRRGWMRAKSVLSNRAHPFPQRVLVVDEDRQHIMPDNNQPLPCIQCHDRGMSQPLASHLNRFGVGRLASPIVFGGNDGEHLLLQLHVDRLQLPSHGISRHGVRDASGQHVTAPLRTSVMFTSCRQIGHFWRSGETTVAL